MVTYTRRLAGRWKCGFESALEEIGEAHLSVQRTGGTRWAISRKPGCLSGEPRAKRQPRLREACGRTSRSAKTLWDAVCPLPLR